MTSVQNDTYAVAQMSRNEALLVSYKTLKSLETHTLYNQVDASHDPYNPVAEQSNAILVMLVVKHADDTRTKT